MERVLTLVAIVKAKPRKREFVLEEILKLLDPTRAEEGCLSYSLHEDNNDPNRFVLYENWETHTLWEKHMKSPHMTHYAEVTKDSTLDWQLLELTKVE